MSSPHDTISALNKENKWLKISFVVVLTIGIFISNENYRLKKDIVMVAKDRADWEHKLNKWEDFNKSFIPETALPRIHEIEAIYMEERK